MGIKQDLLVKIKTEVTTDPENVGYAGKTNAEKLALLNNPTRKHRIVEDSYPAPINRILQGMADMPNSVNLQDIIDALT